MMKKVSCNDKKCCNDKKVSCNDKKVTCNDKKSVAMIKKCLVMIKKCFTMIKGNAWIFLILKILGKNLCDDKRDFKNLFTFLFKH